METDNPMRILFVEDVPADAEIASRELQKGGIRFRSVRVDTKEEFLKALEEFRPDIIISDYTMPGFDGMQALILAKEYEAGIPFIMLTGSINEETAVECMKAGATDYILKDRMKRLPFAVNEALEQKKIRLEKEKADSALRESNEKLREAQKMARLGHWRWDVRTGSVEWSEEVFKIFHLDPNKFTPQIDSILALSPWPEDHERDKELIRRAMESHETGVYEQRFLRPDKSIGYYHSTFHGNYDDDGKLSFIVGTVQDITERKKAEEALRLAHERLRRFVDANIIGVVIASPSGGVIEANDYYLRTIGYTREEFEQGMVDWRAITPPEWLPADERAIEELRERGTCTPYEKEYVRRDGTRVSVFLSDAMLPGTEEQIAAFIIDITERKRAEEELRKLSGAVEQSPASVIITDLHGDIEYVNPKFAKVTGYSLEEVRGKNPRILTSGETPPVEYQKLWETITSGGEWHGVFHNKRKDGTLFWERASISAVHDNSGAITHFIAVKEDITNQKSLEAQLLQAQKLEAVGQLAGGIAHDFNNILTAMIGYGHLIKMKLKEDDPLRTYAEQILSLSDKAANLTQSLLSFSRKRIMNPEAVDLNEIIKKIDHLLSRIIGEDIRLQPMLSEEALIVMADSGQIEQILMNLATNARDAMPEGGFLTIGTEKIAIDEEFIKEHGFGKEGEYSLIAVTDTGAGMDRETREKIFEPFFTTKEVGKGTGLGLSMVYGIIKQHDGYINVYSEPGSGTTFRIYLPLIKGKAEEIKPEVIQPAERGTETVLLAEDEITVREFTKKMLEEYGYKVITAGSGQEAIDEFKAHKDEIQLLLFDVIMPNRNGREAYEEIKKIRPDIKVLFMSGYPADIIHKHDIIEKGFAYIEKPASPAKLLRKIREALGK